MKLNCNGLDLAEGLSKVIKAITGKKALPILEGVKFSAYGDTLTMTATDIDLTIQNKIKAEIMSEGEIVVPGKLTAELVRKMSGQVVELECVDKKALTIKYVDSQSKINCLNVEEFPPILDIDYDICVTMSKKECKDLINKTIFSAASDEVRPILKGCLLKIEKNKINCVALDGHRLAMATKQLEVAYPDKKIIVPAKALFEIAKLMDDNDELVKFKITDKKLLVDMGNSLLISSLIEGEYMSYEKIIPKGFLTEITIIKDQLIECLDRISIISRMDKANLVNMDLKEGILTLTSHSEAGDICERIGVSITGKELKLGLNFKYLTDCLRAISDQYIKFSAVNSTDPCIISPIEGEDYLYLILPIRILA